ncbi:MAG: hypothetical protein Kow0063_16790 [Anaerolineae bacterium]
MVDLQVTVTFSGTYQLNLWEAESFDNITFRILREGSVRSAGKPALRYIPCVTASRI